MWIILLILAAILLLAIFSFWPESGLYSLTFFLPVIGWSFSINNFLLPFIDLLALLVLLAFILRTIFFFFFKSPQKRPLRWPLFFPFAVFFIV